jgi:hypothetical protein
MSPSRRAGLIVRVCATARVVEILFLVLVPTIATTGLFGPGIFHVTDAFSLTLMIGGALGLGWITWRVLSPDGTWLADERVSRVLATSAR